MRVEGSKFLNQQLGSDHKDSWDNCVKHKGMELYGYCVMTSHVHIILGTHGENMEDIMRDMKRNTSNSIEIRNSKLFF